MQLHVLEPLFQMFYTFVCKNFSSCQLKFPRNNKNCRKNIWKISNKHLEKFKYNYCHQNLLVKSIAVQLQYTIHNYFFQNTRFYGSYSTLDYHTNTVISQAVPYSSRWLPKPRQGLFWAHKNNYVTFLCPLTMTNLFRFFVYSLTHAVSTFHSPLGSLNKRFISDWRRARMNLMNKFTVNFFSIRKQILQGKICFSRRENTV